MDSAWRAVYSYLLQRVHDKNDKIKEFFKLWGTNAEWFTVQEPFGDPDPRASSLFEKYIRTNATLTV